MSLNKKKELVEIAKELSRKLRKEQTSAEKIFWQSVRNKKFLTKSFIDSIQFFMILQDEKLFSLLIFTVMKKDL